MSDHPVPGRSGPRRTLRALAAAALGAAAGGCTVGPTVAFDNQSSTDVRVTYWVGRIDINEPGGVGHWTSPWRNNVVVAAGDKDWRGVGDRLYSSHFDRVVRVRVEPAPGEADGAPVERPTQYAQDEAYWFEFEGRYPYRVRAYGDADQLLFESYGEGGLLPVADGERFPFRNEANPSYDDPYADAG